MIFKLNDVLFIQINFNFYINKKMTTLLTQVQNRIKETGKHSEIVQLILDEITITKIPENVRKQIEKCSKLQLLSLNECKLTTLEGFPKLPKLNILEVASNSLTDKDLKFISHLKELKQISLEENNIQKIESLKPLTSIKNIIQIELSKNPVTSVENYHTKVFEMFENLEILDGKDLEGKQLQDESEDLDDEDNDSDEEDDQDEDDDSQDEESEEDRPKVPTKKTKPN